MISLILYLPIRAIRKAISWSIWPISEVGNTITNVDHLLDIDNQQCHHKLYHCTAVRLTAQTVLITRGIPSLPNLFVPLWDNEVNEDLPLDDFMLFYMYNVHSLSYIPRVCQHQGCDFDNKCKRKGVFWGREWINRRQFSKIFGATRHSSAVKRVLLGKICKKNSMISPQKCKRKGVFFVNLARERVSV